MYTFNELVKASKKKIESSEIKVCILGNCSTQFLSKAVKGYGAIENINLSVFEADYDQVIEQIINNDSEMYKFNADVIVIYLCTEKLYYDFCSDPEPETFANRQVELIKNYHEIISQNSSSKIIQFNFVQINDNILGNYGAKVKSSFIFQLRKLNYLLQELISEEKNVFPLDLLSIQEKIGYDQIFPEVQYYNAKLTIDLKYIPIVAYNIICIIKAMNGMIKKCLITDLDNTLWGGNVGDVDLGELEIGHVGSGEAFSEFQRYIKQLQKRGIMLAVCSKNNEERAKLPFNNLEDMELKLSDFLIFTANWEDKATNIKNIIKTLNISEDSVIFIDDNNFERNIVKQLVPNVSVPEMPDDPADYIRVLKEYNFFETSVYSDDDKNRTEQYRTEFKRKESLEQFTDYDSYLKSLEMQLTIENFKKIDYSRIAELSQRSNQFNLRTIRYTENDICHFAENDDYLTFEYTLKDKYGSYGLISVVIMKKIDDKTLFIDTWIMSCRVLKRGVGDCVVNSLIKSASKRGFSTIKAEYIPTKKNSMVKDIYSNYGFKKVSDNLFEIKVDDYKERSCYISENKMEVCT